MDPYQVLHDAQEGMTKLQMAGISVLAIIFDEPTGDAVTKMFEESQKTFGRVPVCPPNSCFGLPCYFAKGVFGIAYKTEVRT